jgi:hypothetical protein
VVRLLILLQLVRFGSISKQQRINTICRTE